MAHKNLFITIVVILILGIGAWAVYALTRGNEQKGTAVQETNQTPPSAQTSDQFADQSSQAPPADAACVRNYDKAKLTAPIDMANRQVELSVKGFGKITVQLYDKDAPKTVENFLRLTQAGFYDCLTFHRVAKNFVIQGGDPKGNGTGGESAFGSEFADELNAATPSYQAGYVKGVLAMANRGPNTNSSQFFIMLGDVALPNAYTIFGKVVAGQDVVDKIGQVDITPQMGPTDGAPKQPIVIEKATIVAK